MLAYKRARIFREPQFTHSTRTEFRNDAVTREISIRRYLVRHPVRHLVEAVAKGCGGLSTNVG
jgi:hypothetical protein